MTFSRWLELVILLTKINVVVDKFMPSLENVDKPCKAALFVNFLEFLKKNCPQFSTEPISSLKNLAQLCYLHAHTIEITRPNPESMDNPPQVAKGCSKLKKAARVMLDLLKFKVVDLDSCDLYFYAYVFKQDFFDGKSFAFY